MDKQPELTAEERAELERLRAEVAALRAQQATDITARGPAAGLGRAVRPRWRTAVATLLIMIACALAPLSVVAVWARNQVTNTDRMSAR